MAVTWINGVGEYQKTVLYGDKPVHGNFQFSKKKLQKENTWNRSPHVTPSAPHPIQEVSCKISCGNFIFNHLHCHQTNQAKRESAAECSLECMQISHEHSRIAALKHVVKIGFGKMSSNAAREGEEVRWMGKS